MKKAYFVIVLFLISSTIFCQHSGDIKDHFKHTVNEVKLDIDETVFSKVEINSYMSGIPKILFVTGFVNDSFENGKSKMLKFFREKKFDKKGEKTIFGKKVFFIEGPIKKDGIDYINKNYCIYIDKASVIMVTTLIEVSADDKYRKMLEKTLQSVVEKN